VCAPLHTSSMVVMPVLSSTMLVDLWRDKELYYSGQKAALRNVGVTMYDDGACGLFPDDQDATTVSSDDGMNQDGAFLVPEAGSPLYTHFPVPPAPSSLAVSPLKRKHTAPGPGPVGLVQAPPLTQNGTTLPSAGYQPISDSDVFDVSGRTYGPFSRSAYRTTLTAESTTHVIACVPDEELDYVPSSIPESDTEKDPSCLLSERAKYSKPAVHGGVFFGGRPARIVEPADGKQERRRLFKDPTVRRKRSRSVSSKDDVSENRRSSAKLSVGRKLIIIEDTDSDSDGDDVDMTDVAKSPPKAVVSPPRTGQYDQDDEDVITGDLYDSVWYQRARPEQHAYPASIVVQYLKTPPPSWTFSSPFMPYQQQAILKALSQHPSFYIILGPGSGKTAVTIYAICIVIAIERQAAAAAGKKTAHPVLFVVPSRILTQVMDEVKKFSSLSVLKYHGEPRRKFTQRDLEMSDLVLTTADTVESEIFRSVAKETSLTGTSRSSKRTRQMIVNPASLFLVVQWHFLIIDEIHNFRNPSTQRSQALALLPGKIRWGLTGTPLVNRIRDLKMLNKVLHITDDMQRRYTRREFDRLRDEHMFIFNCGDPLKNKLNLPALRREQVLIPCHTNAGFMGLYKRALLEESHSNVQGSSRTAWAFEKIKRLQRICFHPDLPVLVESRDPTRTITDPLRSLKLQRLCSDLALVPGNEKSIVFATLIGEVRTMYQTLQHPAVSPADRPYRPSMYTSEQSAAQRVQALKQFTQDPTVRVLITTFKSCGEGINLTAASNIFIMTPWYNSVVHEQAMCRAWRLGQTRPVRVIEYIMQYTIDQAVYNLQAEKHRQCSQLTERADVLQDTSKWGALKQHITRWMPGTGGQAVADPTITPSTATDEDQIDCNMKINILAESRRLLKLVS